MGGAVTRALTAERIWSLLMAEGAMATDDIYAWYRQEYGNGHKCGITTQRQMTLIIKGCGMMRKIGWRHNKHGFINSDVPASMLQSFGFPVTGSCSVWEAKTIDEITKPYLEGKHTLRRLDRMPKFIRKIVEEKRGGNCA